MAFRVSVDLAARRITLKVEAHPLPSLHPPLRVKEDLYSDLKEMWLANENGEAALTFPMRTTGGDAISPTIKVGAYFFLRNDIGWRLQPHAEEPNGIHEVVLLGNLYPEDPGLPMTVAASAGTVFLRIETSSLTQVVTVGGDIPDVNVARIAGEADPAQNLAKSAGVMVPGAVDTTMFTPSDRVFETTVTAYPLENLFKNRIVFWRTGVLAKSAYEITAYRRIGGRGRFTVQSSDGGPMVEAPAAGDAFVVL